MKTRSAFVSNSSSSSFIIENSNQIEVAKTMHQYMVEELEEFYGADDEYTIDRRNDWSSLLEVCKKSDVISGENGIMFASTNYTTTIKQVKDRVFVSTCNNHTWDDCWLQHMIVRSESMDPNMWAEMSDILRNSCFYGAGGDDVLLDGQMYFDPEDETEFYCPKCGINKHFWHRDKDGNPYCTVHFTRMTKVEHNED